MLRKLYRMKTSLQFISTFGRNMTLSLEYLGSVVVFQWNITLREAARTSSPNIAHPAWMRSLRVTNARGKRTVSTKQPQHKWPTRQSHFQWHRKDLYWASFRVTRLFFSGGGALNSNVFTVWWHIQISWPPRAFKRFKRRSCLVYSCISFQISCKCLRFHVRKIYRWFQLIGTHVHDITIYISNPINGGWRTRIGGS